MFSVLGERKQEIIESVVKDCAVIPGALAEVGVYRGANALRMARAGAPKKMFLFDTFSGIPQKGEFDKHEVGDFADTDLESIMKAFAFEDIDAEFRVGVFPETTRNIRSTFSVVHLDGDQYEVTFAGLRYFWPLMERRGVIILDDYGWENCPGVEKALTEFREMLGPHDFWTSSYSQAFIQRRR